jgi:A/G-specific adenine glycosylase
MLSILLSFYEPSPAALFCLRTSRDNLVLMMKPQFDVRLFRPRLLAWYNRHQRPLPWRSTKSAYRIWVSEIMLQQTRVAVVTERYRTFLKRFPSLRSLASSRESDVLAAWSGLGYYRRARALRKAARIVVREHQGKIPAEFARLRMLPGIGDYTAAAIASIAFGRPHAVVDGNVRRVLTRVRGKAVSMSSALKDAQALLSPSRAGDFNQAMMELGAIICTPVPKCQECPVRDLCASKGATEGTAKRTPTARVNVRMALMRRNESVYLVRRPMGAKLMPSMWELPVVQESGVGDLFALKHSITKTNYSIQVCLATQPPAGSGGRWISSSRLQLLPLTGLARKILNRAGVLKNQSP